MDIQARTAIGKTLFMDKKKLLTRKVNVSKMANYKEHSLESSTVCSKDLDID